MGKVGGWGRSGYGGAREKKGVKKEEFEGGRSQERKD